ncbi:hypothetical protein SAMN04487820_11275 [Actinopolyspora mzabensis]|uniref:Uncharacterized protein n=1 Tax=Actinopolyspora mzabensis TaxID=995066 RepID=A0A1G9EIE7_ACTMZ|nr:hypothetical protein SAMN04487820_11275 [Actinopolyspora mzabensis]
MFDEKSRFPGRRSAIPTGGAVEVRRSPGEPRIASLLVRESVVTTPCNHDADPWRASLMAASDRDHESPFRLGSVEVNRGESPVRRSFSMREVDLPVSVVAT